MYMNVSLERTAPSILLFQDQCCDLEMRDINSLHSPLYPLLTQRNRQTKDTLVTANQ